MLVTRTVFENRVDAGGQLARRLMHLASESTIVLALPRGGVVVGAEVANALGAPLDIVAVRKIGAPHYPEIAIGALVDGDNPEILIHEDGVAATGTSRNGLIAQIHRELREIHRREELYRGGRPRIPIERKTVIVVDDGIATGSTVLAALRALRRLGPRKLVLAVPVSSPGALESLRSECDEIVCLVSPQGFRAVGEFYEDFSQTSDQQVIDLLEQIGKRNHQAASRV